MIKASVSPKVKALCTLFDDLDGGEIRQFKNFWDEDPRSHIELCKHGIREFIEAGRDQWDNLTLEGDRDTLRGALDELAARIQNIESVLDLLEKWERFRQDRHTHGQLQNAHDNGLAFGEIVIDGKPIKVTEIPF